MSVGTTKIKSRIKSITGAYKVTSAMKLVSTVKLKQWRNKMLANKEYNQELQNVLEILFANAKRHDSPLTKVNEKADKSLYVIISSTLGLCGSYNTNIFKVADVAIKKNDEAIIIGEKAVSYYGDGEFKVVPGFENKAKTDRGLVKDLVEYILKEYEKGTYKEIHLIYSEYKNSLVFLAKDFTLLPLVVNEAEISGYPPLIEPDANEMIERLTNFYLDAIVYGKLLESEVCEQAARSNAMENATNNAKELLDELQIEFNKARQAAITQEITEIVAAAKAL